MKKLFFVVSNILLLAANISGQLVVNESGQTQLGFTSNDPTTNSTSTLNIWDIKKNVGGSISFGANNGAVISGDGGFGQLTLKADYNFALLVRNKAIMTYLRDFQYVNFKSSVHAPSFLTSSDARLKTNVTSLEDSYLQLNDINPISYNFSFSEENDSTNNADSITKMQVNTDDRMRFGFIAQEVQEVFPNLVVEGEDGFLSIDYVGFIPVLVEAYKKLSEKLQEQNEFIHEVLGDNNPMYKTASIGDINGSKTILRQNSPNPFKSSTTIECEIQENVETAFICIYNLQGTQVMRLNLQERGNVCVSVEASSLNPGMYIYSLIADGNEIDSKRMIITD